VEDEGANTFQKEFEGSIDGQEPLLMTLTRNETELRGELRFQKSQGIFPLMGTINEQNQIALKKLSKSGNTLGFFDGQLFGTALSGTWRDNKDRKVLPFRFVEKEEIPEQRRLALNMREIQRREETFRYEIRTQYPELVGYNNAETQFAFNQKVLQPIHKIIRQFEDSCEVLSESSKSEFLLEVRSKIVAQSEKLISLLFDYTQYMDGQPIQHTRNTLNYHLTQNKVIQLGDFLQEYSISADGMQAEIMKQWATIHTECNLTMSQLPQAFNLTEKAVVFHMDQSVTNCDTKDIRIPYLSLSKESVVDADG